MRRLLQALGFDTCPLCGGFKGHQPGCPYGKGQS